jgi:hypothetical protein
LCDATKNYKTIFGNFSISPVPVFEFYIPFSDKYMSPHQTNKYMEAVLPDPVESFSLLSYVQ